MSLSLLPNNNTFVTGAVDTHAKHWDIRTGKATQTFVGHESDINTVQVMANGLDVILSAPSVRSVFVNFFGGITACDAVANGIVQALSLLASRGDDVTKPLVVRLDGNNAEEGRRILSEAAHPLVEQVDTMDGAARRAAELAGKAA